MRNIDSVLGYHLNPLTCGVAKFNTLLGQELGLPFLSLFAEQVAELKYPLISIKFSEMTAAEQAKLAEWCLNGVNYDLFLHGFSNTQNERTIISNAGMVYCGNAEIAAQLAPLKHDVLELYCPGMLTDITEFKSCEISVFSFGMAHKIDATHYKKLKTLLDQSGKSYCIYVSTAVHEGDAFDEAIAAVKRELADIFTDKLYFLGFLSDDAVHHYLKTTTFYASFFEDGVRANNTSVNSAMRCGAVTVTNLDGYSPTQFAHKKNLIDINQCERLPVDERELKNLSDNAREMGTRYFDWPSLAEQIR